MEISHASKEIERLCTDEKYQKKKLGRMAKAVQLRYQELRIASSVSDLFDSPGRWSSKDEDLAGYVAGHLSRNHRILITGTDEAGTIHDWPNCKAVEVMEVGTDYH